MNKERLEELREEVERHRAFIDDHAMNTSTEDDILALIDAEIVRQSVTDEAVQRAIGWQEAGKASAQNDWERAGAEWRMEPGAQAQHDERMAAFDLAISALQAYEPWVSVEDRLPEKPQYDWVLVHITLSPDGFVGLPHVAELRHGKWFSTEYDLPIEQILQGTVTHWKPLPTPPESEG